MPKSSDVIFDVYMARIREAKEKSPKKRTVRQKKLLDFYLNGPSYNAIFGKSKKQV
ncbi:MAG: hypothetical protein R3F48_00970 [Candidatus Zixiibacteriota bacterium]